MTTPSFQKQRLVDALTRLPVVELAVLFGSAARGEGRKGSDVDVAVRLEEDSASDLSHLEATLSRTTGLEIDLVPLDASPPLLRFEIARDGVVLIERKPYAWADFRAQAMIDWWDWAPTARKIQRGLLAQLREKVGRGPS